VQEFGGVQSAPAVQATHAPLPLQTRFVPQIVPAAFGVPVLSQVCEPVAQEKAPSRHGFGLVAQAPPAVQPTQDPPLQTRFVPQPVPFGSAVAVATHVCEPVAQEVRPVWHGSGSVAQARPATQAVHVPPLQTWFEPQVVPFGSGAAALSTHTDVPVEQDVMPVLQGSGFVAQVWPAVQATHAPALQTWFDPQPVPSARTVPESTHTDVPLEHEVVPAKHGLGFPEQLTPAVQAPQTPPLQTWFVPQIVPFASGVSRSSTQTCEPVVQEVMPPRQGFGFVVHEAPATQVLHTPALQTASAPQEVPSCFWVAVSRHCSVPVVQDVTPLTQGFGFVPQRTLATQVAQLPPLQTRSGPQLVPFGSGAAALSTQASPPDAHEVMPVRHGSPLPVQVSPAVHAMHPPVALHTWFTPQTVPGSLNVAVFSQVSEPVAQDVTPSTQAFELDAQG
jgi:hypothetical protein